MKRNTTRLRARVAAKTAIFRGEQLLLLHRSLDAADPGVWDLPGGIVEEGESLSTAARREVREETGFEVRVGRMYHADVFGSFSKAGKIRPTVGVFFHALGPTTKRPRLDPTEHTEYAWVSLDDLKGYPTVPHLERAMRAAFYTRNRVRGPNGSARSAAIRTSNHTPTFPVPA